LLLLSPLLGIIALFVRFHLGKPVVFRQRRPGLHGAPFDVFKFRTMLEDFDDQGQPLPDERRLTALGRFLRSFSLDELPELWNVLRGEMSIVGPRPLLMKYLPLYSAQQARRHDVLPGITGWAQINGRNDLSWEDKFLFDVWYVDHWSLMLDVKIILRTGWKVLRREGISQSGYATTEEFRGSAVQGDSQQPGPGHNPDHQMR
jgi:lipopolysaccharide/colanic/teichoic acid biosynthesis glycosyltransferase